MAEIAISDGFHKETSRSQKCEKVADVLSMSCIVVVLSCPWLFYIDELISGSFDQVAAALYTVFNTSLYPFIFSLCWLRGRYRNGARGRFYKLLDWRVMLVAFAVLIVWPIHLQGHYSEMAYKQSHPQGYVSPPKVSLPETKPVDDIGGRRLRFLENIGNVTFDYFPAFLVLTPLFLAFSRWCGLGNWRNRLYLSLSLPGVIGSVIFMLSILISETYITHDPNYLDYLLFATGNVISLTLYWHVPGIFLIVSACQVKYMAHHKQADAVVVKKIRIYIYCALIVAAYFWIPFLIHSSDS